MTNLREAIKTCAERLDRYRRPGQRIGEQNTKIMLIEPVLQARGRQSRGDRALSCDDTRSEMEVRAQLTW